MRKHDLISTAFWFLFGLFIVLYAPQFNLGTAGMPGTGLMPFLAGLIVCAFALLSFIQAWLSPAGDTERIWQNIRYPKLITVVMVLIAYTFFFERLGFIICTFAMMYVLMNIVGSMKWSSSLFGALLCALVAYLVFEVWLRAQLPKGILIHLGV